MITEDRAKDLGKKLYAAAASVNTPKGKVDVPEDEQFNPPAPPAAEPVEVPVDQPTASPDDDIYSVPEPPEATDDDGVQDGEDPVEGDDDKPRRKRSKRG
jgi:hypothetical protein